MRPDRKLGSCHKVAADVHHNNDDMKTFLALFDRMVVFYLSYVVGNGARFNIYIGIRA